MTLTIEELEQIHKMYKQELLDASKQYNILLEAKHKMTQQYTELYEKVGSFEVDCSEVLKHVNPRIVKRIRKKLLEESQKRVNNPKNTVKIKNIALE